MWAKVQAVGLQPAYCQRDSIHKYIRCLISLPFLPAAHIQGTFRELQRRANSEKLDELTAYIERQWMRNPLFPVESWSVFGLTVRTNNDTEGEYQNLVINWI